MMLERRHAVRALLEDRGDAVVVSGLGSPTYDVAATSPSERNYYLWGAMGAATTTGLGLALAQPDLHVIVVTGDGELLMALGALATVAAQGPGNLSIVVLDNERYGETGLQQSHTGTGVDLAGVARACGIADAQTVRTQAELDAVCATFHDTGAVKFVAVKISPEAPPRVMPTRDGVENKLSFRKALGIS
jgi:thiamine pyrophosphate-dependent acetolactate synthase large subunit-like protein